MSIVTLLFLCPARCRTETGKEVSAEPLVLASCHGEIGLGEVHEGAGAVNDSLQPGGHPVVIQRRGEDNHIRFFIPTS